MHRVHSTAESNAYAERFVRSIKEECLNNLVLLGECHLRRAVSGYVQHYLVERPHQGLDNELIEKSCTEGMANGIIKRKERLGGLLNYYYRYAT